MLSPQKKKNYAVTCRLKGRMVLMIILLNCFLIFSPYIRCVHYRCILNIINQVLIFMDDNPVFIGVMVAVSGTFWINRYLRKKRIDACFGFYCNLSLLISELKEMLITLKLDTDSNPDNLFNIFALHYMDDIRKKNSINRSITEELKALSAVASPLHNLLISATNNIPPDNISISDWYKYQQAVFKLCLLILEKYNKQVSSYTGEHIEMYKEASGAMDKILTAIEDAQELSSK